MTILKPLLIPAFLFTVTFSYGQWWGGKGIKGNGNITTITRNTPDYDVIKCAGFMDFKLIEGTEGTITLKGDSNLLEHIITEVDDGVLRIKVEKGKNLRPSSGKKIRITVPYKDISKVTLSGSGDVLHEGTISGDRFSTAIAGSGNIVLYVDADTVDASVSGSGDLTLKGTATNLKARVAGSGDFHGFKLKSTNVDASVAGSGDIGVNCTGELKARVAGSGDIEYRGNPTREDTKVTGSGSIGNY